MSVLTRTRSQASSPAALRRAAAGPDRAAASTAAAGETFWRGQAEALQRELGEKRQAAMDALAKAAGAEGKVRELEARLAAAHRENLAGLQQNRAELMSGASAQATKLAELESARQPAEEAATRAQAARAAAEQELAGAHAVGASLRAELGKATDDLTRARADQAAAQIALEAERRRTPTPAAPSAPAAMPAIPSGARFDVQVVERNPGGRANRLIVKVL